MTIVLGIESSCDETAVGIVRDGVLLADAISSSMDQHARFGGVVPEVASRAHLAAMVPTIQQACSEAGIELSDVDAVACTTGPGLAGALVVGVAAAKALAFGLDVPYYGVNHLAAHVAVSSLEFGEIPSPTMAMLVSGGHTSIMLVNDVTSDIELIGQTIDDAAGEAFDKVARKLGLPFPGGPYVDKAAQSGNRKAIRFPRGLTMPKDQEKHRFNVSFSGLKTSVTRWVEAHEGELPVEDVAASFQEAVADVLSKKVVAACVERDVKHLLLGGGAAANSRLRELTAARCESAGIELRIPPPRLCTDNGAMVAALGYLMVRDGVEPSELTTPVISSLTVDVPILR